jgi:choline dehydrogenase-like flavoprotein
MSDYDVIIIGAGAGGPVAAKELAEQEPHRSPPRGRSGYDRVPDETWTHSEVDMTNPVSDDFRWGPGDRTGPVGRRMVDSGLISQIAGVGGTTLHYFGNSPRAYPSPSRRGDWPMSYADLIPYYERVEAILPVSQRPAPADEGAVGVPRRGEDRAARDRRSRRSQGRMAPTVRTRSCLPDTRRGDGCTQCGHCYEGCMHPHDTPVAQKAKRSTNVSYVPHAEAHDGYRLVTDAFATQILTGQRDGELAATGVRWRETRTGEEHEASAEVVVLAGGCIESPRLWLNSGLPDAGSVGRYLTLHWFDFVTGVFDHPIHPYVGQNSQSRIEFPGPRLPRDGGAQPRQVRLRRVHLQPGLGRASGADTEPWDTRGHLVGEPLAQWLRDYDRSLTLLVITDDEIHADNRVTLADDWPDDEHGPVPKVAYRPTPESDRRRDELSRWAGRVLRAAGARGVHRADWPPLYLHMQSSMRMGRDPATSVVDGNQEAWGVKRLFITDASSLPDGLGSPNPTLTLQMFATRTAEHIASAYFGRDPFVLEGAGVVHPAGFPAPATPLPQAPPPAEPGRSLPATGAGVAVGAAALAAAAALHTGGVSTDRPYSGSVDKPPN